NRDLAAEVAAHRFREDLYYRLNVVALQVPPLRERKEELMVLAQALLAAAAGRNHRSPPRLSAEAQAALARYRWPGNVRELRNAMERAVIFARGEEITPDCLPDTLFRDQGEGPAPTGSLEELEREHIVRVLAEAPTLEDAAARLGINTSTLWRKRKRFGID
ncbi:MAG TPA: helix-turn-helix domain-containing protein, partial [Candidatus Binataceae bacterium]|nr:helix-turn-helix domain-containing protein [Candidatus Binataceae bacterium]